jgi:hypothetical protein
MTTQGGTVRRFVFLLTRGARAAAPGAPATLLAVLSVLLLAGCGAEAPADWQWWTSADTAAVRAELARWHGALDARRVLDDTFRLGLVLPLTFADSSSPTGETLYKFRRLFDVWTDADTGGHSEGLLFSRANDTVAMTDTFCQVDYCDTVLQTRLHFRYDSLWVVGYRPDTTVDTTRTPPETTVVFVASSTELRGFAAPKTGSKSFGWTARRLLHLGKTDSVTEYTLGRMTGCAMLVPTAADAPSITWVTLAQPGRIDTFFYTAREAPDTRGIYNFHPLDSLYTVGQNEEFDVAFVTGGDSSAERERFFVTVNGRRTDVTTSSKSGAGTFSIADTGHQHVWVQAVSLSGISTTASQYKSASWAIPVRVLPRQ